MFEVPYALNMLQEYQFDQIYHEHLSYFLVSPLVRILKRHGLSIFNIEDLGLHGGSIRVWTGLGEYKLPTMHTERERALGVFGIEFYESFADKCYESKESLINVVKEYRPVAAIGAAAKATVLCNFCEFTTEDIKYIVDDTPQKIGKYQPGTKIPIVSREKLNVDRPEYIFILAWNYAEEIMQKFPGYQYIIPSPLRVISGAVI